MDLVKQQAANRIRNRADDQESQTFSLSIHFEEFYSD